MADVVRRRFLAAIGLAPAAVLLLAGCPGGNGDDEGSSDDEGRGDD